MSKINCTVQGHEKETVTNLCLSKTCFFRPVACPICQTEQHSDHLQELKPINEVDEYLSNIEKAQQKMISIFRRLEYEIQEAFKSLNHSFSQLITPIENYRKSVSYETLDGISKFIKRIREQTYTESVERFSNILNSLYKFNEGTVTEMKQSVQQKTNEEFKKHFDEGFELCVKGQFKDALKLFDKSLQIDSINIEAIFYKAEALRNLEEYEKSIAEYDRCMKFDPKENVQYYFGKGEALRALSHYEEAIEYFDKTIKIEKKHFNSLFGKADSLRMLGQLQESLKFYDFALQIKPDDFVCLKYKGVILEELGLDEFLTYYRKAAKIDPNDEYLQTKISLYEY